MLPILGQQDVVMACALLGDDILPSINHYYAVSFPQMPCIAVVSCQTGDRLMKSMEIAPSMPD
jgi:hypothetical protein